MKSRRMKFFSVLVLALVFCASLSMGIAAMAADEAKPDTGLEYYVQCVASGSQSGGYQTEALPVATDVPGLELPANQSATSRAFDVPTAEGNGEIASADMSGRRWGLYYGSMNMWGYYAQAAAGGDGAWYETCEPGSIYGSAVWSANDKIVYKFELPDSTTEYDVVVGANNTPLGNHWDAGFNQCASAVFINGEDTPSAVTGITNTNQNVVVKGVTAEATDADTGLNNILTITIDKPTGEYIPDGIETVGNAVVSFIMITRSDATQPLVLDTSNAAVMSTVKGTAEQLPATVEVLTTQGMKAAGVTYTDLTQFNDAANRFMLNDITVKGKLFGVYDCDIPLMFIPSGDTYYYADSGARWVDGAMPAKAFEAMDPILNPAADKIFDQTSDGSTWGRTFGGDPGGEPWPINPSPYFSHVSSAQDPDNDNVNKVEYLFPDLEAGNYLVYVSVVTAYNGGTANVSMVENDQQIGTFDVAFKTDSWAALVTKTVGVGMMEKKGSDPVSVSITCQDAGFYVGFVLITEASNDVGGDDVDQAYFLLAGNNPTNIPVDGIGLPANQTVGVRNFNDPNGGAARADLSGKYWGL